MEKKIMICPNCGKNLGFCPLCGAGVNDISTNSGSGKIMVCSSCGEKLEFCSICGINVSNSFKDPRDKKVYKTVTIGKQVWMAENLAFDEPGSKCYNNDPANCQKYGRLYDWETAKKACPTGWHLPSNDEWQVLVNFAGGNGIAGKKLKAKEGWNNCGGTSGNGTDDYGFAALPGGYFDVNFRDINQYGRWWSFTEYSNNDAYFCSMKYHDDQVHHNSDPKSFFASVRCVKD